jgi:hypothetical protein
MVEMDTSGAVIRHKTHNAFAAQSLEALNSLSFHVEKMWFALDHGAGTHPGVAVSSPGAALCGALCKYGGPRFQGPRGLSSIPWGARARCCS